MSTEPASAARVAYARSLVRDRDIIPGRTEAEALAWFDQTLAQHGMTNDQASRLITAGRAAAYRPGRAPAAAPLAEPGFYLRDGEAFKVVANDAGTGTYANRWTGHGWEYAPGVGRTLGDLTPMTAPEAARIGLAAGRCISCSKTLGGRSLPAQVAAVIGYGETCAKNHGWPFPTGAKAQRAYLADHSPI